MNHFLKLTVLFFAILLSTSTGTDNYGRGFHFSGPDKEDSKAYLSDGQLKSFDLFRSGEHFSGPISSFPVPDLKNHLKGFPDRSFAVELFLQGVEAQYLFYSREICLSLTIRDIIFPFHYFW